VRYAAAILAATGCGTVFGLDPVSQPTADAAADGAIDAPTDMPVDVVLANHDEDSDGFDDALDVCPAVPDPLQLDGDGDQVGDACDPHPTLSIDRLYLFDSFQTLSPRWTNEGGVWVATGADSIQQQATGIANNLLLLDAGMLLEDPTIDVAIADIGAIDAGALIKTGGAGAFPECVACYLDDRLPRYMVYYENRDGVAGSPMAYPSTIADTAFPVRVVAQSSTGVPADRPPLCTLHIGATSTIAGNASVTAAINLGSVGLYTYAATATFTSATVYVRR
jgi:hypothetical protein